MPGAHHIEARVFKDVFPRFRTMQGYHVGRKAGWDCHGLPVELAVEKELGFNGKKDIEAYGIAEFNAKCRESVTRHTDAFAELTTRMGYWVDLDDAYRTMDPDYIESVWWSLKEIFNKGLLVQDHRVAPWCPRCGTGLSDHELAQGYETVVDPSVYVRLPLTSGPLAGRGRAADLDDHALDPGLQHRRRRAPRRHLRRRHRRHARSWSSPSRCWRRPSGEGWEATGQSFTGARDGALDLRAPVRPRRAPEGAHFVVNADYVTTEDGTGLVHQAPAFGEDDLKTCQAYGLPVVNPVRPDGTFEEDLPLVGGQFFKKADEALVDDLARARSALPPRRLRAQLPALLALPHRAALLRAAVLVHPHHRGQGRPAAGEREHQLVPGLRQARPVRRLAQQQHRLGAVPQPLLGHPAAHLALRGGPPHLRRLAAPS